MTQIEDNFKNQFKANLQLVAKLLRIRDKPTVRIPFIKPRAAPDLCKFLLPVHSSPHTVIELHIIPAAIGADDHIFRVWLNWGKRKEMNNN